MDSFLKLIATLLISSTLIACGGGGGGGGGSSSGGGGGNSSTSSSGSSNSTPVTSETAKTLESNAAASNQLPPLDPPAVATPPDKTVDITLSWVAPTTRENGDALLFSEIDGYEIYYFKDGTSEDNDQLVSITDPNTVDTTISNLTAGTYYFAIATLDSEGLYSDTSDYVELVID
jgi:hypothetical protein